MASIGAGEVGSGCGEEDCWFVMELGIGAMRVEG